jgi:hypothetical protein
MEVKIKMTNLKEFIDKLQKIYDEAKTSAHTSGNYPPDIGFYFNDIEIDDYFEIEIQELNESYAACCADVIGASILFRKKK